MALRTTGSRLPVAIFLALALAAEAERAWAEGSYPYVTVSAAEAFRQVESGNLLLIDVRTPDEWTATGVAHKALRLSIEHAFDDDDFVQQVRAAVDGDRSRPVAVICTSGPRSLRAWNLLIAHAFTRVMHVAEGMNGGDSGRGWIAAELPVEGCALCKTAVPVQ